MNSDDFKKGVILPVMVTIPFYVAGYYPPEKQGDKLPPHEHIHVSSDSIVTAQFIVVAAQPGNAITFRPGTQWPVRF